MKNMLNISATLSLALSFVTDTSVIIAKKRQGKSYTADVIAEEMLGAKQQIIIFDPTGAHYGLRSSANGKRAGYPITILGGKHGDAPLEVSSGKAWAEAVVSDGFSVVLDLSLMDDVLWPTFIADFTNAFYRLNESPCHVFYDEADTACPQTPRDKEHHRCLRAVDNLVRRGGIKGIGVTMITQRPALISKDVLSQVDQAIVLRMNNNLDLDAIERWWKSKRVKDPIEVAKGDEVMQSLPALARGQAWVWNPGEHIYQRIQVRRKHTFDSGKTPEVGAKVKTVRMAPIDVRKLGASIAAAVEKASANDPKALKARIVALETKLAAKGAHVPKPIEHIVEKPIVTRETVLALERSIAGGQKATSTAAQLADRAGEMMKKAAELMAASSIRTEKAIAKLAALLKPATTQTPAVPTKALADRTAVDTAINRNAANAQLKPSRRTSTPTDGSSTSDGSMPRAVRAMIIALVDGPDGGLTRKKLRIYSGYSDSGPTSKAMAMMLSNGWATQDGGKLAHTEAGLKALGGYTALPKGAELREHLLNGNKLTTAAKNLFRVVCDAYPNKVTRAAWREAAGYSNSGPTSKAMSHLVGLNYVTDHGREGVAAASEMFE